MAMMEISVVPVGTGTASISGSVAGAVSLLRDEPDITWELTPMGTVVQGELDRLLAVAGKMHRSVLAAGAVRVVTKISIDERTDKPLTIDGKLQAVKEKLG